MCWIEVQQMMNKSFVDIFVRYLIYICRHIAPQCQNNVLIRVQTQVFVHILLGAITKIMVGRARYHYIYMIWGEFHQCNRSLHAQLI